MPYTRCKYHSNGLISRAYWVFFVFILAACGVKRNIPKGQYLLKKNVVTVEKTNFFDFNLSGQEEAQIIYKPNKRVLLGRVPFFLWLYSTGTKRKHPELSDSTRWRRALRKQGEPPVILDSLRVFQNATNIENYLFNKGYFDAEVDYQIKTRRHKAVVTYVVKAKQVYVINSFFVACIDSAIRPFVVAICDSLNVEKQYFRPYRSYASIANFTEARAEITRRVRNMGYYDFNPNYIKVELDTLEKLHECKVTLFVNNRESGLRHQKYSFGSPMFTVDVGKANLNKLKHPKHVAINGKHLVLNHYNLDPTLISSIIYIDSGGLYSQKPIDQTYQSLLEMEIFSYVDIQLIKDTFTHTLYPEIYVRAMRRMGVKWEPQGLYSPQGNLGTAINTNQRSFGVAMLLSYTNRNLNGHAEKFTIGSITSAEAIFKRDALSNFRYGLQQGFNAQLELPHFNLLNKIGKNEGFHTRKTIVGTSFQFENNPNFLRRTLPAGLTFKFSKPNLSFFYSPAEVSYLFSSSRSGFLSTLNPLDSAYAQRVLFTPFLVMGTKVGFVLNKPLFGLRNNSIYLRSVVETSGNTSRWISAIADPNFNKDVTYSLFNVQLSRYLRAEFEVRYKYEIDELNTLAFRFNSGAGVPFGNGKLNYLPYDKLFFIGGSNSLRGWRPRRIGPGDEPYDSNIIDKAGEMLIEASTEYRFTLVRNFLHMALFADAGNIWNINHPNLQQGTKGLFDVDSYADEIAFNTGLGSRFDFGFFLFRLDWGWPLHDPTLPAGNRWMFDGFFSQDYILNETALTIGIGYPF